MSDRSLTDHPSLSGTDYVLEGASIRDRFLTAFILRHNETSRGVWPQAAGLSVPSSAPDMTALLPAAEEETFSIRVESRYEPLTVRVIDTWFGDDEDDDM